MSIVPAVRIWVRLQSTVPTCPLISQCLSTRTLHSRQPYGRTDYWRRSNPRQVQVTLDAASPFDCILSAHAGITGSMYEACLTLQSTLSVFSLKRLAESGFAARRYAGAVYAVIVCVSVCSSVRPSHAGTIPKRLNVGLQKQRRTIAQGV